MRSSIVYIFSPNIIKGMKSRIMRDTENMGGEMRNVYKIRLGNPKVKAPFGCDGGIYLFI
jgi:hypothetical protein